MDSYNEILIELNATINSNQIEQLLLEWMIYDPKATGFITFEHLVFLLFDLPAPLGYKSNNQGYNLDFSTKDQDNKYLINEKKHLMILKKNVLRKMKHFNLELYFGKYVHIKDVFINIAKQVICTSFNMNDIKYPSLNQD